MFTIIILSLLFANGAHALAPASSVPGSETDWSTVIDTAVNPCVDFYKYACGNWMKANPIPPDQPRWGRFVKLQDKNRDELKLILEDAAHQAQNGTGDRDIKKIGYFYSSCIDTASIETAGLGPLEPDINRIEAVKAKKDLTALFARLQVIGANAAFGFSSEIDDKNANLQIAVADQGGFNLPDRQYYVSPEFSAQRAAYKKHILKMLELSGESADTAGKDAQAAFQLESALAKAAMSRVERRKPANVYHMEALSALERTVPDIDWPLYLRLVKSPSFHRMNIADPGFFKGLEAALRSEPISSWKAYLRWQLVHAESPALTRAFVAEDFSFFGRFLSGQKQIKPRWKRCVIVTDALLGEALGKEYAAKYFPGSSKIAALAMVHKEEKAMAEDIKSLSWMTPKTKAKALVKLNAIQNKIGYPDKWRDYSKLSILPGDALGNFERAQAFEFHRETDKIGAPTNRNEWEMTPPTVNAYYDPQENNINFPAGILQPPYFQPKACLAENVGAIGAVIGHEMTHAFDDQGRQYDPKGNRRDWWTKADAQAFKNRAQCFVNEYSGFTATDDPDNAGHAVKLNGKLTLGENTADNGGLRVAYRTLHDTLLKKPDLSCADPRWTNDQIFFLSFAQVWCNNETPQSAKELAASDYHSPGEFRVNGVVSNMPEFLKAFDCSANSPMARVPACRVW
ncbi:MAG: M13 family metallopeptidase [Elusimicrobiota bacterium]